MIHILIFAVSFCFGYIGRELWDIKNKFGLALLVLAYIALWVLFFSLYKT